MKKKLLYLIVLVILGGIISGRIWCAVNNTTGQDKTKDGEDQEFLHIVSFPQEEIPIKKWIKEKYHTNMGMPFVVFRIKDTDYISNGYDPEYWKSKI